ncbi:VOC family protein [Paenibacillus sp. PK4536]|uniref:VOC family protein n=1 Tax=Paenibacillus sp. PK4536 TaxID=3024576 RepID=UPI0023591EC3|nr:VOC family protein [Paenibacillus sp. PK4536]WIM37341.1 VOC family protein [Paenibacillus sp. PK4536]
MIKGLYEALLPVKDMNRSLAFYEKLGLEIAHHGESLSFVWIEKGVSWLGLWEGEQVNTPYHPSLRHIAFRVDYEDIKQAKEWLEAKGIAVREVFGFQPIAPIVLPNRPQAHTAIYFDDPDGNLLEFICPIELDTSDQEQMMYLYEWEELQSKRGKE